jgi:Na+/H+-translocating membrane pyrophosphatase
MESENPDAKLTDDTDKMAVMNGIGKLVSDGARAFLIQEYKYLGVFVLIFALIIFFAVDLKSNSNSGYSEWCAYTTVAFLLGAVTSVVSGYIGMMIATYANTRTAYCCTKSLSEGFQLAYRSGCVMGFSLVSLGLLVLIIMINIY